MTDGRDHATLAEHRRDEPLRRRAPQASADRDQLQPILTVAATAMDAARVALTLVDAGLVWDLACSRGRPAPLRPPAGSLVDRVVTSGEPATAVLEVDPAKDTADEDDREDGEVPRPARWCGVPVGTPDGAVVGALTAVWPDTAPPSEARWRVLADVRGHLEHVLELRAEVAEYGRFVELAPDAALVLDAEGDVELTNPALCAVLGYDQPDDLVGRPFVALVAPEDRARVTSALARVLFARRRTVRLDVGLLAADGGVVHCSVSAGHLQGPRRRLRLAVHDLTDRLRDEEQRAQLSEQLARAQRLDAVGQVAGGLAHDLNNLLVVMTSNLALADESLDDLAGEAPGGTVEALRQDLAELRIAVSRANDLTGKLVQFARDDSGERFTAEVGEVVEAVRGLVSGSLDRGVRLEIDVPANLPPVAADPLQLERALLNLIINARDAVGDEGTITVSAAVVASAGDGVGEASSAAQPSRDDPAYTRIDVLDDGVGMDETTRARAFEPLWSSKRPDQGTGLGLPTVASFADKVDGSVSIDTVPGEGTRVALHVPVAGRPLDGGPLDGGRLDEVPVGVDVPVGGARVVLIEPGERTRRVIGRMLRPSGYRVRAFGTAGEALAALREDGAELLICEVSLPDTDGGTVVAAAREAVPELSVVLLASVDGAPTLDGVPLLVKPFSHHRLLRTVREVLAEA